MDDNDDVEFARLYNHPRTDWDSDMNPSRRRRVVMAPQMIVSLAVMAIAVVFSFLFLLAAGVL